MNQDEASAVEGLDLARLLFASANDQADIIDELTYRSYRDHRSRFDAATLAKYFEGARAMERRYLKERA